MADRELTAEEKLAQLEKERSELKEQVKKEKEQRKANREKMRAARDQELDELRGKVSKIQEEIYAWNKLGKAAKIESQILSKISEICGDWEMEDNDRPEDSGSSEPDAEEDGSEGGSDN